MMILILLTAFTFWKAHMETMAIVNHTYVWNHETFRFWSTVSAASFSVLVFLILKYVEYGL